MKRNCSLNDISDGNLYDSGDLAAVNCNGCKGLASCCHGMGNSIILDPYDIYRLTTKQNLTFERLLQDKLDLNVVDGIILPNLKMAGEEEGCTFLNNQGRCSIHAYRPGICRIFPLGRYYENHGFKYFMQIKECPNNSAAKRKISKWIDTPDIEKYEAFLVEWHYFLNAAEDKINNLPDDKWIKNVNMLILNHFYVLNYEAVRDFYPQFYQRLNIVKKAIF